MKEELGQRARVQLKQDELWKKILRYHCDRHSEMEAISQKIGKHTHNLNQLIGQLTQYKKTHKAMNLAYSYLSSEIARIDKIVDSTNRTIRSVNAGRCVLTNSRGVTHTDTRGLENYVRLKTAQRDKLKKWKDHVQKYAA